MVGVAWDCFRLKLLAQTVDKLSERFAGQKTLTKMWLHQTTGRRLCCFWRPFAVPDFAGKLPGSDLDPRPSRQLRRKVWSL